MTQGKTRLVMLLQLVLSVHLKNHNNYHAMTVHVYHVRRIYCPIIIRMLAGNVQLQLSCV